MGTKNYSVGVDMIEISLARKAIFIGSLFMFWVLLYLNVSNAEAARRMGIRVEGEFHTYVDTRDPRMPIHMKNKHLLTKVGAYFMLAVCLTSLLAFR